MKITFSILAFCFIAFCSFKIGQEVQKELTLKGEPAAFQALLDCVENSNEPHTKVEAVKKWVIPQLQKQLQDTTIKK
jgi:hypothetical protein